MTVAAFVSLESLLLSNSPSPPAGTPHPAAEPVLYTAVGQIDGYPSTDPRFCLTGDFGSVFDGPRVTRDPCLNETILRNVDARKLPMTVLQGGGLRSKGTVRVAGTYADGVLTLTKPPAAAKPVEPNVNFPIPCVAPVGGWHGSDAVNISQADESVMNRFVSGHRATF